MCLLLCARRLRSFREQKPSPAGPSAAIAGSATAYCSMRCWLHNPLLGRPDEMVDDLSGRVASALDAGRCKT